jgi:hypothetical protein
MASRAGDQAQAVKDRAMEQAEAVRDKAMEQADAAKDEAADRLQSGARSLRERAEGAGGTTGQAGVKVADTMERTAGYLREHDTADMWNDFEQLVRDHPRQALVGALVAGFVLGRIVR